MRPGDSAFEYLSITVQQALFQSEVCQIYPKHTSKTMQLFTMGEKVMTIF